MRVRVMVTDVWNDVSLEFPWSATVRDLKHRALTSLHVPRDPSTYVLKYRGAAIGDDDATLADIGLVENAHVIVLPRRRRPVQ